MKLNAKTQRNEDARILRSTDRASRSAPSRHSSLVTRHSSPAFSLIEILITVGLLSFIILGLLLMFNQVQRAFRSSMTQTDVMESGRAVMDMLVRDIEEMTPWQLPYTNQLDPRYYSLNFMSRMTADFGAPLLQDLPGTTLSGTGPYRTNVIQQFFFTTKSNQTFSAIGYRVIADYTNGSVQAGLGTLYRYTVSTNKYWAGYLPTNYFIASQFTTNMHRIADGIVHLRVLPFDTNGAPMFGTNANSLAFWTFTNFVSGGSGAFQPQATTVSVKNAFATNDYSSYGGPLVPNQQFMEYWFYSNAVPAYVELEMGILEPHTLEHYRALAEANLQSARNYLQTHSANVHVFRRRIPIHAVDYMAYR